MIARVGNALRRLGAATLSQLAVESHCSAQEVDAAMAFWMHRGNARRCRYVATGGCGTACRACPVGESIALSGGGNANGAVANGGGGSATVATSDAAIAVGAPSDHAAPSAPLVYEWVER